MNYFGSPDVIETEIVKIEREVYRCTTDKRESEVKISINLGELQAGCLSSFNAVAKWRVTVVEPTNAIADKE